MSGARTAELIVKIDPAMAQDPVAHLRHLLDPVGAAASIEEVFPGLRSGASAGLVSVRLSCAPRSQTYQASVEALRDDAAVVYVEEPKPRRTR